MKVAWAVALLFLMLLSGCEIDRTAGRLESPPVCEVHHKTMQPGVVELSTEEIEYLLDYEQAMRSQFPHHGGTVLHCERQDYPLYSHPVFRTQVRDFVCPDCDAAYHEYWRQWRQRVAAQSSYK
jgi:hypothetical protein